jgi:hypothetical protein
VPLGKPVESPATRFRVNLLDSPASQIGSSGERLPLVRPTAPYLFPLARTFFALVDSIGTYGFTPRLPPREDTRGMHLRRTRKGSLAGRTGKRKSIRPTHDTDHSSRYCYAFKLRFHVGRPGFVEWRCQYVGNVDITRSI